MRATILYYCSDERHKNVLYHLVIHTVLTAEMNDLLVILQEQYSGKHILFLILRPIHIEAVTPGTIPVLSLLMPLVCLHDKSRLHLSYSFLFLSHNCLP